MSGPEVKQKIIDTLWRCRDAYVSEPEQIAGLIMDALTDTMTTLAKNAAATELAWCAAIAQQFRETAWRDDMSGELASQLIYEAIKGRVG